MMFLAANDALNCDTFRALMIGAVTDSDGVMYEYIDALAKDVGAEGIFSDWPATVTYYANCMGLD